MHGTVKIKFTKRNFVYLKLQSRKHRLSATLEWLDYFVYGRS